MFNNRFYLSDKSSIVSTLSNKQGVVIWNNLCCSELSAQCSRRCGHTCMDGLVHAHHVQGCNTRLVLAHHDCQVSSPVQVGVYCDLLTTSVCVVVNGRSDSWELAQQIHGVFIHRLPVLGLVNACMVDRRFVDRACATRNQQCVQAGCRCCPSTLTVRHKDDVLSYRPFSMFSNS